MLPSESTAVDKAGHAGIRAYGTVAMYVQNIRKEGGNFFSSAYSYLMSFQIPLILSRSCNLLGHEPTGKGYGLSRLTWD